MGDHPVDRAHQRFTCDMAIWLSPQHPGPENDPYLVEVRNIGGGGVLCLVHTPFKVDQQVDLHIELPQRSDMVPVKGRIRHARKVNEEMFLVGIQFLEVEDMTVPAFMAYIEALFV